MNEGVIIMTNFSDLVGKTFKEVTGLEPGSEKVFFECTDGSKYRMMHYQDCCETVSVESVVFSGGENLSGAIVYEAEEINNADGPIPEYPDSYTWTFYKLKTSIGYVDIRWLGESNGYYGEEVDFEKII